MRLEEEKEKYISLIGTLIEKCNFNEVLFGDRSVFSWMWDYLDSNRYEDEGHVLKIGDIEVIFTNGATKLCFHIIGADFVLKMPYRAGVLRDYCRREYDNYISSIKEGVSKFFAPCYLLQTLEKEGKSISFYLMEYITCNEEEMCDYICESFPNIANYYELDCCSELDEEGTLEFLEEEWGSRIYTMFLEFCERHNINDLHSGNIGRNKAGNWVFIDYSGYNNF